MLATKFLKWLRLRYDYRFVCTTTIFAGSNYKTNLYNFVEKRSCGHKILRSLWLLHDFGTDSDSINNAKHTNANTEQCIGANALTAESKQICTCHLMHKQIWREKSAALTASKDSGQREACSFCWFLFCVLFDASHLLGDFDSCVNWIIDI